MGAGNVKLVFARWGHLAHAPFRGLVYMAVVSLDDERRFWQGRDALAVAMGATPSEMDDADARRAAFRRVDRVIAALRKAHAIDLLRPAAPGHNAEYLLLLDGQSTVSVVRPESTPPVDNVWTTTVADDDGRLNGPRSADTTDHGERRRWTTVRGPTDHAHRGPEEQHEYRGVAQDYPPDPRTPLTVARANGAAQNDDIPIPPPGNPTPRSVNNHRASRPAWPVTLRRIK
jgi:hypothetical protein